MTRLQASLLVACLLTATVACDKEAPKVEPPTESPKAETAAKDKKAATPDAKADSAKKDAKGDKKAAADDQPTLNSPWPPKKFPNEQTQPEIREGDEDSGKTGNEQGQSEGNGG